MSGLKLLLKIFPIRVWGRIVGKIELSKSPVRRIRDKAAESKTWVRGNKRSISGVVAAG
jgi:hypothetical protein